MTVVQRSAACAAVDSWARAWGYIAAESWLVRREEYPLALVMAAELLDHCDALADSAIGGGQQPTAPMACDTGPRMTPVRGAP